MAFEAEVDRNFEAFVARLPEYIGLQRDEFALIRHGKVEGFYRDEVAALSSGRASFVDGLYSVQQVSDRSVDLGFFSHAINTRLA